MEKEAIAIGSYQAAYIHGLLQIPAYMEAVAATKPSLTTHEVGEANRLKLLRQEWVFDRPPGKLARMRFILDEACFLRIKKAPYYDEQMQRLLEVANLAPVEIYVLPIGQGFHPSMPGSYTLMSFEGPYSPELLYLESLYGARYIDDRQAVAQHREVLSDTLTHVVRVEEYLSDVEP